MVMDMSRTMIGSSICSSSLPPQFAKCKDCFETSFPEPAQESKTEMER